MPQENIEKSNMVICKNLRTKMYYVQVAQGQNSITGETDDSTTQYWCLKTLQPIGPDDQFVNRDSCCKFSRTCFESPEI
jgi:hypothetical protein